MAVVRLQISRLEHLTIRKLTDEELEDTDVAEDAKVSTFVSFLAGCRKIGMPLQGDCNAVLSKAL